MATACRIAMRQPGTSGQYLRNGTKGWLAPQVVLLSRGIRNGIDAEFLEVKALHKDVLALLHRHHAKIDVLFVGRLHP